MKKALIIWSFLFGALILAVLVFGYFASLPTAPNSHSGRIVLRANDRAVVARGAEIYVENCASCHGADLKGEPNWQTENPDGSWPAPPHDASGHTWHHADELLFTITKYGTAEALDIQEYVSNMPKFGKTLGDEEIIAVLSWIKAQWPDEIRQQHDALNEQVRRAR
ncbi:MAG: c-type cytochrome [Roseibium sp.]|uniref:c-type cytochrome n=1 Tax=Roseibium sp. TaxID=1936156 RepID=UPI002619E35F|nr:c-type cytochrome [Roseibium sp.]MCV0425218.1 c-type cytochrome [Roseibium sp.]